MPVKTNLKAGQTITLLAASITEVSVYTENVALIQIDFGGGEE